MRNPLCKRPRLRRLKGIISSSALPVPVAFVVLGALFTFFQVVPLVHRSESRTSNSSSEPKIPTLSWGTTTTSLGMSVFLHRVTPENRAGRHFTDIDNPHTNKNPKAIVLVTPNWNYDGSGKIYNDHAIGVWYRTETNKWSIFNQDKEEMVIGTAFNVMVADAPSNSFDASMDSDDM